MGKDGDGHEKVLWREFRLCPRAMVKNKCLPEADWAATPTLPALQAAFTFHPPSKDIFCLTHFSTHKFSFPLPSSISLPSLTSPLLLAAVLQQREVRSRALRRLPEDLRVGLAENHHHARHAQLWPERHLQCGPDRNHVAGQPRHHCRWVS